MYNPQVKIGQTISSFRKLKYACKNVKKCFIAAKIEYRTEQNDISILTLKRFLPMNVSLFSVIRECPLKFFKR